MKTKFTHKEFTLMAGVIVALIIMMAFWLKPAAAESGDVSKKLIPSISNPDAKTVVKKAVITIQALLN